MTNTTDITNLTDATFDVLMDIKADPNGSHAVDHLSAAERADLAGAMKWNVSTPYVKAWIKG